MVCSNRLRVLLGGGVVARAIALVPRTVWLGAGALDAFFGSPNRKAEHHDERIGLWLWHWIDRVRRQFGSRCRRPRVLGKHPAGIRPDTSPSPRPSTPRS